MVDAFLWPLPGSLCPPSSDACTDLPISNKPSAHIYIKSITNDDPTIQPCDWTTSTLNEIARHELGHAIGMEHPTAGGAPKITGTAPCTTIPAAMCPVTPGYATVMKAYYTRSAYPACASIYSVLQPDDLLSAGNLY